MNKENYQLKLDEIIKNLDKNRKYKLLLHSCCGPCSSYVLEYLSEYFNIVVFYYNPNIYPEEEYFRRLKEQEDVINQIDSKNKIELISGEFETKKFYDAIKGLEKLGEGTQRCFECYSLRMREAAVLGEKINADFFTTTLSISPYKNAEKINEIGSNLEKEYNIRHLPSDFKKKGGYQRSIVFSKEHNLYRQDYCGCVFSQREAEKRRKKDN
ncbi:MAG: epoxyqueuosine reductase QueH [Tissierellia bacterium]|nr:epoxyqueuosine reductase QueH [Tissierellia bacterium]